MKPIEWMASSKKDLKAFPAAVQDVVGRSLLDAQFGDTPANAKPLKGFGGAGVLEIVEDHDRSTYRAVYTVDLGGAVYVLHAFQKKSTRGIATPKPDLDLIHQRYKAAEQHYRTHYGKEGA